jgi:hypothetical protein
VDIDPAGVLRTNLDLILRGLEVRDVPVPAPAPARKRSAR